MRVDPTDCKKLQKLQHRNGAILLQSLQSFRRFTRWQEHLSLPVLQRLQKRQGVRARFLPLHEVQLVRVVSHGSARVSRQKIEHGKRVSGVQRFHVRFRKAGKNATVWALDAHVLFRNVHASLLHLSSLSEILGWFHRLFQNAWCYFSGRAKENVQN